MNENVLQTIRAGMDTFSKGQKRIAAFILDNYDRAAFMTAARLGETASVSESTVVRFAAQLGYDGYPEMQKALQELIRGKLTSIQRIQVSCVIIPQIHGIKGVCHHRRCNIIGIITIIILPKDSHEHLRCDKQKYDNPANFTG